MEAWEVRHTGVQPGGLNRFHTTYSFRKKGLRLNNSTMRSPKIVDIICLVIENKGCRFSTHLWFPLWYLEKGGMLVED